MNLANKILAAGLFSFAASGAMAATSFQSLLNNSGGTWSMEDDSVEVWIDNDSDGALSVGDVFHGAAEWPKFTGLLSGDANLDGNEANHISAIFETVVVAGFDVYAGGTVPAGAPCPGCGFFFGTSWVQAGTGSLGFVDLGFGPIPIIANVYEDSVDNVNLFDLSGGGTFCATVAACDASIADGSLIMSLGIDPTVPAGQQFFASDPLAPGFVPSIGDDTSQLTNLGGFTFNLGVLATSLNGTFGEIAGQGNVQGRRVGCGALSGPGACSGAFAFNSSGEYDLINDAQVFSTFVPEPSVVALLGLGLLGGGLARRMKSAKSA